MIADSHQTGTLEISRRGRSIRFGVMASWLIIGVAVASLLVGLFWSYNLVRYPGAEREKATLYQVRFQYRTVDDLPRVLRWYTQQFGLSHEVPQGENCVIVTGENMYLFLQQSLAVTLCAHQRYTLIFVNRSLALR